MRLTKVPASCEPTGSMICTCQSVCSSHLALQQLLRATTYLDLQPPQGERYYNQTSVDIICFNASNAAASTAKLIHRLSLGTGSANKASTLRHTRTAFDRKGHIEQCKNHVHAPRTRSKMFDGHVYDIHVATYVAVYRVLQVRPCTVARCTRFSMLKSAKKLVFD